MDAKEFESLTAAWADDRNITWGSTPKAQLKKLTEEFAELTAGVIAKDIEEIKDAIGDCDVVLRMMEKQLGVQMIIRDRDITSTLSLVASDMSNLMHHLVQGETTQRIHDSIGNMRQSLTSLALGFGLTIGECRQCAWDSIKHRTGKMVDGVFCKDAG